jgi:sulfite reductase (NADPH) flavoprotein alpha-component
LQKDDVEAAVLKAIAQHSGKGPEYAAAFVADMIKQKRYLRDVY